ncbi:ribosomal protein S5 domain 2-type protein [Flagelloscypha sp. PMI_526]|nr:ribosomal protein S5 domain 2-type protein [Flagelloscypha sp. PMI_526]
MSRVEILTSALLRSDGRRPYELRAMEMDLSVASASSSADGFASVSQGLTAVSASVFGPREAKSRRDTIHDRAVVNVQIVMAPFAGATSRRRRGRNDKQLLDQANLLSSTFTPIIQTHLFPRCSIDVIVHVLQSDGSLLSTCINAITLALISAGIPMTDFICATTIGVHGQQTLLDLTTIEENELPSLVVATTPQNGKIVLLNLESRVSCDVMRECLKLGRETGEVLWDEMRGVVKVWGKKLVRADTAVKSTDQMDED